ncbi:MAG: hypothetical protein ACI4IK_05870 [Eubacterium sp.]
MKKRKNALSYLLCASVGTAVFCLLYFSAFGINNQQPDNHLEFFNAAGIFYKDLFTASLISQSISLLLCNIAELLGERKLTLAGTRLFYGVILILAGSWFSSWIGSCVMNCVGADDFLEILIQGIIITTNYLIFNKIVSNISKEIYNV